MAGAAGPAAVAFACGRGGDRLDEAVQGFAGSGGALLSPSSCEGVVWVIWSAMVSAGRSSVGSLACGAVGKAARLRGPWRDDELGE